MSTMLDQDFGQKPLEIRDTEHYQKEYVQRFVEKWDELIDWDARAKSEGQFFVDILKGREKVKILDVATGTGFHSVQLLKAGFEFKYPTWRTACPALIEGWKMSYTTAP